MHDFDDLLGCGQAGRQLCARDSRTDAVAELLDDFVVDVCLEQGQPDFAQSGVDVFGADQAAVCELLEGGRQPVAERFEHQRLGSMASTRRLSAASWLASWLSSLRRRSRSATSPNLRSYSSIAWPARRIRS